MQLFLKDQFNYKEEDEMMPAQQQNHKIQY